jgi:beta-alanine--pyruvate transaminase
MDLSTLATKVPEDLSAFWMPFTANRAFKSRPRLLASADGMYYRTPDGREILDGTAGLWCVNAGHNRPRITAAIKEQAGTLDYAPAFQLGHPLPFALAAELVKSLPDGLDRIFFTGSGSESVDTALKMALAFHRARGEGSRVRLIGRQRGYHGTNFGGMSVGGIGGNRRAYAAHVTGVDHLSHTHSSVGRCVRGQPESNVDLAAELEDLVALHGPETIAAVIVEPVAGSTGVLVPPAGYLKRLRELCTKHGILLIFDEVITGFGRLGAPFAAQYFDVTPDMMTTAKGLTNAAIPMGAVFVDRRVHDAFMQGPEEAIEFFHGYTYSAHPAACAAGLATLDIYARENLFEHVRTISPVWEQAVHALRGEPHIKDLRNIGLIAGIELESRAGKVGQRAYEAMVAAFEAGLLIRVTGETIALSPPLIISTAEIEKLFGALRDVLRTVK